MGQLSRVACQGAQKPQQSQAAGGHGRKPLTRLFLGRDSDLQSARPRAETKPAEELRSWEKKQRAPLRYSGCVRGWRGDAMTAQCTCAHIEHQLCTCI